ncbi:MAG: response regulator [Firmicutes bacterium]|nr:response regulator [Bacillota bacterium]
MKLVLKLAIPQIIIVIIFGIGSFLAINSSFNNMREEHVRDVLENRVNFILDQINISAQKSVRESSLFVRQPAVIEAYKMALHNPYGYKIDEGIDGEELQEIVEAQEFKDARAHLHSELGPMLSSYRALSGGTNLELHFHLPNGLSLARMWRVASNNDGRNHDWSDDLRSYRFTVMHVIENKGTKLALGLEPGSGGFAIRGVVPIFDPGEDGVFGTGDDIFMGTVEVLQQFPPIITSAIDEAKVFVAIYANRDLTFFSADLANPELYPPFDDDFIRVIRTKSVDAAVIAEAETDNDEVKRDKEKRRETEQTKVDLFENKLITSALLSIGKTADGIYFENYSRDNMTLAVHPLFDYKQEQTGVLICAMDTSAVSGLADTGRFILFIMLLCMTLAPITVLLLRSHRLISVPLAMVKSKIRDIAEDRADLSEQVPDQQKDEIGDLAYWFNTLTAKLDGILKERQSMMDEINDESEKFRAMVHWYGSILDSIPFLVSVQNMDMKWTFVNAALEKILGKKRDEVMGLACSTWNTAVCNTENCAVVCSKRGERQTRFTHNGVLYQVDVATLKDLHGKITGFIEIIQDITSIEQLAGEQAQAKAASQAKSNFLANMSHEMRTPMNAIIGMARIAEKTDDVSKLKYCLTTIDVSSRHLLAIINDVLDMSKIEAGKFELEKIPMNIEKMLMKICNIVIDNMEKKGQKFSVFLGKELNLSYVADDLRLSQVITNLLSNAVKFTPAGGKITLSVEQTARYESSNTVRFSVTDTGIGMTGEQISRLFNAFEQADGSVSRKYGGTGLGLVISKNIVEKMGGRIWVESVPGVGSTFSFEVTLERAVHQDTIIFDGIRPSDIRLLVVEHDDDVRKHLLSITDSFGIRADTAADGAQTVALLDAAENIRRPYDIVFLDYHLPGTNGVDFVNNVGSRVGKNAVIIITTYLEWHRIEKSAFDNQLTRFITKPLFPSSVLDAINDVVGSTLKNLNIGTKKSTGVPDLSGISILLAEDVEINREIFIELLKNTKIKIDTAESGAVAVAKFGENPDGYDLVVMDIQMPEMDGYQATRAIRAMDIPKAKSIPIIAMTANAFKEDIDRCLESGMNDHLAKPIDEKAVIEKIMLYSGK